MAANTSQMRLKQIKLIHIAKKHFAMDDDTYRDVCFVVTGQRSSGEMDFAQRSRLLDHFAAKGFVMHQGKRKAAAATTGQRQIGAADQRAAMWSRLLGHMRELNLNMPYVDAIAKRVAKKERCEFCDYGELRKVLAAVEIHARRIEKTQANAQHN